MSPMLIVAIVLFNIAVLTAIYILLNPGKFKGFLNKIDKSISDSENRKHS